MALAATTVFEVQAGGSDTNGGGYAGTGTDYSQQAAAQLTLTNITCTGDTTLTDADAGGSFTDAMIGNILYLSNGEWYQIISKTDTDNIVVDRNGPTDTGMTLNVGGALATPGGLGAVLESHGVSGMKAWIKSGSFNLSSDSQNVSGGGIDLSGTMANVRFFMAGYETTRGDHTGTRPIITNTDDYTPTQIIKIAGNYSYRHVVDNIDCDGHSQNINGVTGANSNYNAFLNCSVSNCDGTFVFEKTMAVNCKAYSCAAYGFSGCTTCNCWADLCSVGFHTTGSSYYEGCIASNCTSHGYYAVSGITSNCVSYNNGTSSGGGFYCYIQARGICMVNCLSYGDSNGYAFTASDYAVLVNCAAGGYGSGRLNGTPDVDIDGIDGSTLTTNPFTSVVAGSEDFRLNDTAGGGLVLQASGIGVYGQTDTPDINAISAIRGAGGGGTYARQALHQIESGGV